MTDDAADGQTTVSAQLFDRAEIALPAGKSIRISAPGASIGPILSAASAGVDAGYAAYDEHPAEEPDA